MAGVDSVPAAIVFELADETLRSRFIGPSDHIEIIVGAGCVGWDDIGLGAAAIVIAGAELIAGEIFGAIGRSGRAFACSETIGVAFTGSATVENPGGSVIGLSFEIVVDAIGRAVTKAVAIVDRDDDVNLGCEGAVRAGRLLSAVIVIAVAVRISVGGVSPFGVAVAAGGRIAIARPRGEYEGERKDEKGLADGRGHDFPSRSHRSVEKAGVARYIFDTGPCCG